MGPRETQWGHSGKDGSSRALCPDISCAHSSDGVPFLMHDERLGRTTNVASVFPERISAHSSDFSWAELQRLNAGAWFLEVRTPAKMRPAPLWHSGQSPFQQCALAAPCTGQLRTVSALVSLPDRKKESLSTGQLDSETEQ